MIMYSKCGEHHIKVKSWNPLPRFWEKAAQRQWGLVEPRDQDQDPAEASNTDQAQAGGAALVPLAGQGGQDVEQRTLGDGRLGGPSDTEQPQGGHGDGQPQARRPLWMGHAGALPLPVRPFGELEALLDPGPQSVPAGSAGLGGQSGEHEPRGRVPYLYTMLKYRTAYVAHSMDGYEQRYRARMVAHLTRRAQELGYTLVQTPEHAPA
jgi:hypothetical protein